MARKISTKTVAATYRGLNWLRVWFMFEQRYEMANLANSVSIEFAEALRKERKSKRRERG